MTELLKIHQLDPDLPMPCRATSGSSGLDLYAKDSIIIEAHNDAFIKTGIRAIIPYGYELQIRSRSRLATKGIVVANSPGTVDSDYRGEICVVLLNHSDKDYQINRKDRIAQMVLCKVEMDNPIAISEEEFNTYTTDRNDKGFGSSDN